MILVRVGQEDSNAPKFMSFSEFRAVFLFDKGSNLSCDSQFLHHRFFTGWSYFSMSFDWLAAKVECDWLSFDMWRVQKETLVPCTKVMQGSKLYLEIIRWWTFFLSFFLFRKKNYSMCILGGFMLESKMKGTRHFSNRVGREQNFGSKESPLGSRSRYEKRSGAVTWHHFPTQSRWSFWLGKNVPLSLRMQGGGLNVASTAHMEEVLLPRLYN